MTKPTDYVRAGFALVPIPTGSKGPVSKGWNLEANAVTTETKAKNLTENIGLAHAYSGTCCLDFDDLAAACTWLMEEGINPEALYSAPDAVRLLSGRENRAKLLYRLPPGIEPLPSKRVADGALELRCATSKGTTVQDVLPPSIHPGTGKPYYWQYADELIGDWRHLPVLPADVLALWQSLIQVVPVNAQAPTGATWDKLRALLADHSPDCGYDEWIRIGMSLHHDTGGEGFGLWAEWSAGALVADIAAEDKMQSHWNSFGQHPNPVTLASLRVEKSAAAGDFDVVVPEAGKEETTESPLYRYYAYLPMHQYIHRPTGQLFPAPSVNGELKGIEVGKLKPVEWLDKFRNVTQMTWAPGRPEIIEDSVVADGGLLRHVGERIYNLYREPPKLNGDASQATPWLNHLQNVYPEDWQHLSLWFAQRVQDPANKINHAIVLGGAQGIGKDTILDPVKEAIGRWNSQEISPPQMLGRFNGWTKSVMVTVNEARDLGDVDRFAFYDHSKSYIAAPPEVLRVDEKHMREYNVLNVMGVVITTNHKTDGVYLPEDDRRHYVAWSELSKADFDAAYWDDLWNWYQYHGGYGHVAAYLKELDISAFNTKAPPPKTAAFWEIVAANENPTSGDLAGLIEELGRPDALTVDMLKAAALVSTADAVVELFDLKHRRMIPHKMEQAGYASIRNDGDARGKWKVNGKQMPIYVRRDLPIHDRYLAAERLRSRC